MNAIIVTDASKEDLAAIVAMLRKHGGPMPEQQAVRTAYGRNFFPMNIPHTTAQGSSDPAITTVQGRSGQAISSHAEARDCT